MFSRYNKILNIYFSEFDIINVTNMINIFNECYSLECLFNICEWKTINVANMWCFLQIIKQQNLCRIFQIGI